MLKPLRDLILVKPIERVKSSVIQVVMDERPNMGEIVAVGPGKIVNGRTKPLEVKVGQIIRYGDTANNHLAFPSYSDDSGNYLIMQEADVCFIQEEQAA